MAWINLVRLTLNSGASINDEFQELLAVHVSFPASTDNDPVIEQLGDRPMIAEMEKVFFSDSATSLGHSYASLMSGPNGRRDLQDIVTLLRAEPSSRRAVVTLSGRGDGQVPCINVVQFLVRNRALHTVYFSRGQDAFQKFYADGLCVAKMARRVAVGLGLPAGIVEGFISSSHVYHRDRPAIDRFLANAAEFLPARQQNGVC
jgi:thymidylate synthase